MVRPTAVLSAPPASPADAARWQLVHDVTMKVDRQHFWHVIRNERIAGLINRLIPTRNASYLEIGCGAANVIGYLFENGLRNCTGWDISPYALETARNRYPQVQFELHDFLRDDPGQTRFDIVGSFDCLEHFPDEQAVLKGFYKLVKPGGYVILTVPAMRVLWSIYDEFFGHYKRYEKTELQQRLSQAGFINIQAAYMMAPLVPPLLLSRKTTSTSRYTKEDVKNMFRREGSLPNPLVNLCAKLVLRAEHSLFGMKDIGFGSALIAAAQRPVEPIE
ncbi:MAG: hypothetical protein C5B53_12090 [Candidatus Melainabacteria bacterium]|nr:MAG: hypothetical protein C5B53_12090 [Candidatus Melainabacteria bacterium]